LEPSAQAPGDERFAFFPVQETGTEVAADRLYAGFSELTEYVKSLAPWSEESRARLLEFQNSTAGQLVARLQKLGRRHPTAKSALRTFLRWMRWLDPEKRNHTS
jgi:hypothetical protein